MGKCSVIKQRWSENIQATRWKTQTGDDFNFVKDWGLTKLNIIMEITI